MSYKIKIGHIYPDLRDMYGDSGNIAALTKRMQWRGMDAEVIEFTKDDKIDFADLDIVLLGGGSDNANNQALSLLQEYKNDLKNYVENNGVLLAICGGYPMLGKYIESGGEKKNCLEILDIYTENASKRFTGNVLLESEFSGCTVSVVGFENHGGKTFIGNHKPFGKVLKGFGNCGDNSEGVTYKNIFATYLHGPLLPKNPMLTDEILKRALEKKYGEKITFSPLDDTLENTAHVFAENL